MKTAVIIVTCNSPERIKRHLECISKQTQYPDLVLIVNNGADNIDWIKTEYKKYFDIDIIRFENIGPAGGFKEGAKKAYADGFECIIFADDDAYPVGEKSIESLVEDIQAGEIVATGYCTDGGKMGSSNHYFAYHRSIFSTIGFYFDPFFLMGEDVEYQLRLFKVASIYYDKRVIVDHPWRLTTDSFRFYLSIRNSFIRIALYEGLLQSMALFYHYIYRAVFILIFLRKPIFLNSFIGAFVDFALFKTGRVSLRTDHVDLKEVDPKDISSDGKNVFVALGMNIDAPCEVSDDIRSGFSNSGSPSMAINAIRRFSGKNIILANLFMLSFPPFPLFARAVYWYDVQAKKTYLFYRNNPFAALLFNIALAPLAVLLTPFALAIFIYSRVYYKGLMRKLVQEDLEYCRNHDNKA